MLPKHFFKMSRKFSDSKWPGWQGYLKYNFIYLAGVGLAFFGFNAAYRSSLPPDLAQGVKEKLNKFKDFQGLPRPQEADRILGLLEKGPVLIYGPKKSGKTFLMKYLDTFYTPSVLIELKPDFSETLNGLNLDAKISDTKFLEYINTVTQVIYKDPDTLVLIDNIESLPLIHKANLIKKIKAWTSKSHKKIVLSTNSREIAWHATLFQNFQRYLPEDLSKEEFHSILKFHKGYLSNEIDRIWDTCGCDLDYGLEMLDNNYDSEKFLKTKEETIHKLITEITDQRDVIDGIKAALKTVNSKYPLGNVFPAAKGVKQLQAANLLKDQLNKSVSFRNHFVVKVLKNLLSQDKNG
jgi:hypothetical protein